MAEKSALAQDGNTQSVDALGAFAAIRAAATNQRTRLMGLLALLLVVGIFSQSTLINTYLLRDYEHLEQSQLQAGLRLVRLGLERQLRPLEAQARELAAGAARSPSDTDALRRLLRQAHDRNLGFDVAAVFDAQGAATLVVAFDRLSGEEREPTPSEVLLLERQLHALHGDDLPYSGWSLIPDGLFATAAHVDGEAASAPSVVAGRALDAASLAALGEIAGTWIETYSGEPRAPASATGPPLQACERLSPNPDFAPHHLCVRLRESIVARGQRSSDRLRLASLAGFVVLMFGAWWLLDRSLLKRLARLRRKLDEARSGQTEGLERAMLEDGRRGDELGQMAQGLGALLGQVRQAELDLRERERSFRALAESSGVATFVVRDGVRYSNPSASTLTGYGAQELQGKDLVELVHEACRARFESALTCGDARQAGPEELCGRRPDGTLYWARLHISRIEYQGQPAQLVTLFDLTPQRQLEQVLADEKRNLQVILSSIHDGIVAVDDAGTVRFINPAAQRLTGIPPALAHGSPIDEVLALSDPDTQAPLALPLLRTLSSLPASGTVAIVSTPQGQSRSVELSLSPFDGQDSGTRAGAVLVMRDVSDLRQLTRILADQATHDDLTGLINRREFARRLLEALALSRRSSRAFALCYVDLDQFKLLNDTCGHHAGDLMLREVSEALRAAVGTADTLARLGGDEFGVLLADSSPERAVQVANELRSKVACVRFQWGGQSFGVDASVGIAMLVDVDGGVDEALSLADAACFMAKDLGRNRVHLYRSGDAELQLQLKHMRWATRLKDAVEHSHFCLYAQGIVPVSPQAPKLNAAEVLVRMRQPDGRLVAPEEFLSAAERYQMMSRIDQWVVQAALAALEREKSVQRADPPLLFINLSGQSLGDEGFRTFLLEQLDAHPDLAHRIVFEVTESAVISSLARAKRLMADVYQRGCAFALDDFGTGMSSFGYLKELRVDYLKIAGTFIKHIANPLDAAVVRSFTEFARMMRVTVIAEWIEDDQILETVRDMGVDYGQGWHFGRPQPIEQALGLTA